MNRIVFENPRGNIKVTGGDTQEVTVNGHKLIRAYARSDADRTNADTPVEIVPQGDRLLVRTNQDRAPDNQRISDDLEVTVPRGMAVEARGRSGDYEISDVAGDVELAADRGDVRLARVGGNARLDMGRSDLIRAVDVKGKLDLQGRGSDVELENIAGQVTINGGYNGTLDFKNLAKPLQFEGARNTELSVQAVPGSISMDLGEFTASGHGGPGAAGVAVRATSPSSSSRSRSIWRPSAATSNCSPGGCRCPPSRRTPAPAASTWCCRRRPPFNCRPPPSAATR